MKERNYREIIRGLRNLGPIEVNGEIYDGGYLSALLAIDPTKPVEESDRTVGLVFELGRFVAAAFRAKEIAELEYRQWRDGMKHDLYTDEDVWEEHGFEKRPPKTEIEQYVRTLDEYEAMSMKTINADEAWQTLSAAYEAAKVRQRAVYAYEANAMDSAPHTRGSAHAPVDADDDDNDDGGGSYTMEPSRYDRGEKVDVKAAEAAATDASGAMKIPSRPAYFGPPGTNPQPSPHSEGSNSKKSKRRPPPPKKRSK